MFNSSWPHGLSPTWHFCPWNSPGKNTGVGCHSLLQRKIYTTMVKMTNFMLSVQLSGTKYIHIIVQLSPLPISRSFSSIQIETLYQLNNNSPFPLSPWQPLLYFQPFWYCCSSTLYKWNHTRNILLWLAYFIKPVLKVHLHCSTCQNVHPL